MMWGGLSRRRGPWRLTVAGERQAQAPSPTARRGTGGPARLAAPRPRAVVARVSPGRAVLVPEAGGVRGAQ